MTRPALIPFKAEHLLAFEDRDKWLRGGWKIAYEKERGGPAYTALAGDEILGCAGIVIPWPGMGVCWVTLSERAMEYKFWVTRICKRAIEDIVRANSLYRLEAVVLEDSVINQAWIEKLGFERESGVATKYSPDHRNALRYERIIHGR